MCATSGDAWVSPRRATALGDSPRDDPPPAPRDTDRPRASRQRRDAPAKRLGQIHRQHLRNEARRAARKCAAESARRRPRRRLARWRARVDSAEPSPGPNPPRGPHATAVTARPPCPRTPSAALRLHTVNPSRRARRRRTRRSLKSSERDAARAGGDGDAFRCPPPTRRRCGRGTRPRAGARRGPRHGVVRGARRPTGPTGPSEKTRFRTARRARKRLRHRRREEEPRQCRRRRACGFGNPRAAFASPVETPACRNGSRPTTGGASSQSS